MKPFISMQHQKNNKPSSIKPSRTAREEQQSLNKLMLLKRAVDKLRAEPQREKQPMSEKDNEIFRILNDDSTVL